MTRPTPVLFGTWSKKNKKQKTPKTKGTICIQIRGPRTYSAHPAPSCHKAAKRVAPAGRPDPLLPVLPPCTPAGRARALSVERHLPQDMTHCVFSVLPSVCLPHKTKLIYSIYSTVAPCLCALCFLYLMPCLTHFSIILLQKFIKHI